MGIKIDLSCSRITSTDMILDSSVGLDVTTAPVKAKTTQISMARNLLFFKIFFIII